MTTLSQAPKPLNICGVKVYPKWFWSKDYERLYRSHMREISRKPMRETEATEFRYKQWLSQQRGLCSVQEVDIYLARQRAIMAKPVSYLPESPPMLQAAK